MRAVFLTAFVFIGYTWSYSQNPFSNVAIRFPDDVLRNYCGNGNFGAPEIYNPDSLNIVFTYEYGFITPVPDACVKLEKTWYVSNADFYNPLLGCISVPNPHPSPSLNNPLNLPDPTISAPGTLPPPWNPTVVKIDPLDPLATNYAVFYTGGSYMTRVNGVPTTITVPAYKFGQLLSLPTDHQHD